MSIKQNLFSKKLISSLSILAFFSYGCQGEQTTTAPQPQPIPVSVTTLQSATLTESSDFIGVLEAVERVNLAPRINGRIMSILVEEGESVTQGQLIAELEPEQQQEQVNAADANIQSQIAAASQAQAELRQREAEKDASSAEVNRLKASVTTAEANLQTAEADLQRAIADLDLAKVNYERSVFLVNQGVVPKQDLDNKTRDLNTAKSAVEAQRKTTDAFSSNVEVAREALRGAQSNLSAASERVQSAVANVERAQANIDQSRGQRGSIEQTLVFTRIASPINGVVADFKEFKRGDFLNIGQTLTTITNNERFHLNLNIPAENINRLRMGLPVEIVKQDNTPNVKGSVTYISPSVDQSNQSINIKITFVNDGSLKDQQYVTARVIWNTLPGVLVPTNIVTSLGGQKFVFLAQEGENTENNTMVARQTPIQVGAIQGQDYQVISGIQEGDRIITSRILDLRDKSPIKVDDSISSR